MIMEKTIMIILFHHCSQIPKDDLRQRNNDKQ